MKKMMTLLITMLLITGIAGCGNSSKAANDSGEDLSGGISASSDSDSLSTQSDENDSAATHDTDETVQITLADKLNGYYRVDASDTGTAEEYYTEMICVGGMIITRNYTFSDDEAYEFNQKEYLPDDSNALEGAGSTLKCTRWEYESAAGYTESNGTSAQCTIDVTGDGINITEDNDGKQTEISYVKVDNPGNFYSITKEDKQEFTKRYPISDGGSVEGDWILTGEVEQSVLSFNTDGSFTYLDKVKAMSPTVLSGVWGMDNNGDIRVICEQYASGLNPREYKITWSADDSGVLTWAAKAVKDDSEAYDDWLPTVSENKYKKAESGWTFPDYLFYSDVTPIEEYYSKSGTGMDEDGNEVSYDFRIPKLTDDTEGAARINDEIKNKYEYYANMDIKAAKANESIDYTNINWFDNRYKNIVSIVVYSYSVYEAEEYSAYCYNVDTGEYMDDDALLKALGMDRQSVIEAIRIAAKDEFLALNDNLSDEIEDTFVYREALAKTVSDEYVDRQSQLIVDATGELISITPIATLSGAGYDFTTLFPDIDKGKEMAAGKNRAVKNANPEKSAPSDEDAMDMLAADEEMQAVGISDEMTMVATGETKTLAGEVCAVINLGTDHDENFVTEYIYAVSGTKAIYQYDVVEDKWSAFNVLAIMYESWGKNVLFAVYTNPDYASFWYDNYDTEWYGTVRLMEMRSGVDIRIEQIEYNEKTQDYDVVKVVKEIKSTVRGETFTPDIEMTETIPSYRIVAEYNGLKGEWYATYDGKNGDGTNIIKGQ